MSKGLRNPWTTPPTMSKGAGSSKSNPPAAPPPPPPPPPPVQNPLMANKEDFNGNYQSEFTIQSLTKKTDCVNAILFDVDIGNSSLVGVLGGIGGLDDKGVDECFKRHESLGSSVFRPIVACKKEGKLLLIGEEIGENFENWLSGIKGLGGKGKKNLLKIDGRPIDEIVKVGRALLYVVTKNHQKRKYIGNIREGLRIKRDQSIVIVPTPELKWKQGAKDILEGIKKDIRDLKWFISIICQDNAQARSIFNVFCPEQSLDTKDLDVLLKLSYLMCHYPIFWGTHERYVFAGIIRKVCSMDKYVFSRFVPLDDTSILNVGRWFDKVKTKTTQNQILFDIYHDTSNAPKPPNPTNAPKLNYGYDKPFGICSFIGNAFEHYFEKDKTKTLEDLDDLILEFFPHVYLKIYGGMMRIQMGERFNLYGLLQSGGLNFCN